MIHPRPPFHPFRRAARRRPSLGDRMMRLIVPDDALRLPRPPLNSYR